jgi:hypothetical protein
MVGVLSTVSPASAATLEGCRSGHLCLYKGAYYNNHSGHPDADYVHCLTYNLSNWVTHHGSYVDNQTGAVTTTFWSGYNGTGTILRRFQSYSYAWDVDFYPVNSITVC